MSKISHNPFDINLFPLGSTIYSSAIIDQKDLKDFSKNRIPENPSMGYLILGK